MRSSFLAILCLSVAGAMAEDLILGERQEGDYVVTNRTIFKPAIPWKAMRAVIGVKTASTEEVLTQVKCTNIGNSMATFSVMKGDVGTENVLVLAFGALGEGLNIHVEGYAISIATTTEPATSTTEVPTTEASGAETTPETTLIAETTEAEINQPTTNGDDGGSSENGSEDGGDDGNGEDNGDNGNGEDGEGGNENENGENGGYRRIK
ncbi:hypothetical protein HN011_007793 [Eciton burchellii]|nr:hypothetical protein HN011_007793 [Eciton burchellii]